MMKQKCYFRSCIIYMQTTIYLEDPIPCMHNSVSSGLALHPLQLPLLVLLLIGCELDNELIQNRGVGHTYFLPAISRHYFTQTLGRLDLDKPSCHCFVS